MLAATAVLGFRSAVGATLRGDAFQRALDGGARAAIEETRGHLGHAEAGVMRPCEADLSALLVVEGKERPQLDCVEHEVALVVRELAEGHPLILDHDERAFWTQAA